MAKMIAETDQTNLKIVPHLLVNQDSFSVKIVIASFQCIFAIAMMIVATDPMRRIAPNIPAMANSSNVKATPRCPDSAFQPTEDVTNNQIVPTVKMNSIVPSKNVPSTISSASITTAFPMFGFVTATTIAVTTRMKWHFAP